MFSLSFATQNGMQFLVGVTLKGSWCLVKEFLSVEGRGGLVGGTIPGPLRAPLGLRDEVDRSDMSTRSKKYL